MKRQKKLLHALNAAAKSVPRSGCPQEEVLRVFGEQLAQAGLCGCIWLLPEQASASGVFTLVRPGQAPEIDSPAGFSRACFKGRRGKFSRQVLENGSSMYTSPGSGAAVEILPPSTPGDALDYFETLPGIFSPLEWDGRVQGLLTVFETGLSAAELPVVDAFANQLSAALDRSRLYADLQKTETRYRALVENTASAILIFQDGRITYVNRALEIITGYTSQELLDAPDPMALIVPSFHSQILARQQAYQRGEDIPLRAEFMIVAKNGEERWVDYESARIEFQGRPAILGTFFDITERKRVEDALLTNEQKLLQLAEELSVLYATSLEITASQDLPALLKTIVEQAARLLDAAGGALYLCDPGRKEMRLFIELNQTGRDNSGLVIKYGEGAAGTVASTGDPLIIDDYCSWSGPTLSFEAQQPYTSMLSVPLLWKGEVIGVLQALDEAENRHFMGRDVELLLLFANQAAAAIENARLFEAERAQLLFAQTLQAVGALITFPLELQDVLENILGYLGNVVKYDSASIQLLDEDGILYLAAGRGFEDIEQARQIARETSPMIQERWAEHRLCIIHDTYSDPGWMVVPGSEQIRSWVGAPLLVKGRFIGVLNVDSFSLDAYDAAAGETVMAFANQAAIAIENARLFDAERSAREQAEALRDNERTRVAELEAVRRASLSLTASLDLPQVLNAVLKGALDLFPEASQGQIFFYNAQNQRLTFGASFWKPGAKMPPSSPPRPDGLTSTVARTGKPVVVEDMRLHPLFTGVFEELDASIVGLPLKIGQRVVGVMNIAYQRPRAFPEREIYLLQLVADQAAIAIENARLFEQAATERRHLRLLYDIGRKLSSSLDKVEILREAITLTCQALHGNLGQAFLYLPEDDRVRLCALHGINREHSVEVMDRALSLSSEKGLEGWVVRHRQAAVLDDVSRDPRWQFTPDLGEEVRSAITAPIQVGGRLLGVLTVSHLQPGFFSNDQLVLMQAICQQVGLALSNADRYQQIEHLASLLSAEQQRLENLVEHLPVGVLLLTADYHLLVANPQGQELLSRLNGGSDRNDVISHLGSCSIEELISHHQDLEPVEITLDGPLLQYFEAQARQVGSDSQQWVIMLREVTQERDGQARIQMQERLATVGQLAAGIAHDFNNIMAAILVYSDLLKRDPSLSPASHDRLLIIQQQVERAASLIRQILDFSRRSVMEQSPLDLLPFIKELDKMLERVLPEVISLELNYQPGVYLVNADPTRLQQVFMNLALNARDAMAQGGVLRFGLARFELSPGDTPPAPDMPPGDWIRISVQDTGVGIPPEVLPHIFEPFFTTKPVGQGTGLGLAQVYGIVKQHGAFVDVHSRPDQGTTFSIYIPALAAPEAHNFDACEHLHLKGSGETLLLVEDDQTTLTAFTELLEEQNYRVLTASSGLEALECYEQNAGSIALVISDVVMPQLGGVDLYLRLCERWPEVRILFVTGHPLDEDSQGLLQKGGVHWLQKPFSIQELVKVIRKLLSVS